MRIAPMLFLVLMLTGCEGLLDVPERDAAPVKKAALSGRERALIYGADGALQQGNVAAAERDYLAAVAMGSGHVDAHLALANLYLKSERREEAKTILAEALELEPNHAYSNYRLGKLQLEDFEYREALESFTRGLIQKPGDLDLLTAQGVAYDMQGDHKAAQRVYARAMEKNANADLRTVRNNLAMSYLLDDNATKAVDLLKPDAAKPKASSVTRHNLALAYGLLGRHPDARKLLDGALDEESRMLAIARMKQYHRERAFNAENTPPPFIPEIREPSQ
jgi:Flp pilus assembly protein TadD